ncbi:MAG: ATP phosphoribosyltransferase [Alphaproteobacteria bacterium]
MKAPDIFNHHKIKPPFVFALPKGRVMGEAVSLLKKIGIDLPDDFLSNERRRLITELPFPSALLNMKKDFSCLQLVEIKNWDVFSFVASSSAVAGILGRDIWEEKLQSNDVALDNIYVPLDLKIGQCRLATARLKNAPPASGDKKIVASKYPNLSRYYYQTKNQAIDVVALSGSLELAPAMGLCDEMIDLVATGRTLADNGLCEGETILDVSSLLVVNRVSYKTYPLAFSTFCAAFEKNL